MEVGNESLLFEIDDQVLEGIESFVENLDILVISYTITP